MTQITEAIKKKITQAWHEALPSMEVYKPMMLARRVGPYVQGLCLDRRSGNDSYVPTLFLHSLCRPSEAITLSMGQFILSERSGLPRQIKVKSHDDSFSSASRELLDASLLPLEGNISLGELFDAYSKHRAISQTEAKFPIHLMEDAVSAAAYIGENDRAIIQARSYLEEASSWPEIALRQRGDLNEWSHMLLRLASSTSEIQQTVTDQGKILKIDGIPVSSLIP